MRVVVNALSARLGGGQTYLKHLLSHLPAADDLDVLVFAPESLALPQDARIRRGKPRWPTSNPLLRSVWERLALPGILRRERADLLFCPGGLISTRPPPGCRTATMFRNMTPFDTRARASVPLGLQRIRLWMLEHLMLESMAKADLTIFISEFARGVIECRITLRQARTIPHGISPAFRTVGRPLARPAKLPPGDCLLYVSKFDSYKHQLEVVHGFSMLPRELQRRHPLVLIGEMDHASARLVLAARDGQCEPGTVHLLGPIPYAELPAFYAHASAFVFASSCENCPNILLEALGSGRPVLSSNVMPMPEFGGPSIEYFSPFDPADIARALRRVLDDPVHARAVGAAALQESLRYDWATSAARTWAELRRLVRGDHLGAAEPAPSARTS